MRSSAVICCPRSGPSSCGLPLLLLPARCSAQQLAGVLEGGRGFLRPPEHTTQLFHPLLFGKGEYPGLGPPSVHLFLDPEVHIGKGRDLGEMGNADDLALSTDPPELPADHSPLLPPLPRGAAGAPPADPPPQPA